MYKKKEIQDCERDQKIKAKLNVHLFHADVNNRNSQHQPMIIENQIKQIKIQKSHIFLIQIPVCRYSLSLLGRVGSKTQHLVKDIPDSFSNQSIDL